MTEWRAVPGFGQYRVSDSGAVMRGFRYLKPRARNGYLRVSLSINNRQRDMAVHRLVAEAFIGPCPEAHQVAHLNGVRSDNRLVNLCYKTRAANEADKIAHGTSQHGERNQRALLTSEGVADIRRRVGAGEMQKDLAAEYRVSRMAVSKAVRGETWGPKECAHNVVVSRLNRSEP